VEIILDFSPHLCDTLVIKNCLDRRKVVQRKDDVTTMVSKIRGLLALLSVLIIAALPVYGGAITGQHLRSANIYVSGSHPTPHNIYVS
jgi:hypothetical protein